MDSFKQLFILLLKGSYRKPKETFIALSVLGLAFLALVICLGVNSAKDNFVKSRAREILAGDLQISSVRPIQSDEEAKIGISPSREIELLATLRSSKAAALIELKAITSNYPLVGHILTEPSLVHLQTHEIWLADELRLSMGLKIGDTIQLGNATFKISAFILADQGLARGATGFAPRGYIVYNDLPSTQLVLPGSQTQYRSTFVFSKPLPESMIEEFRAKLKPDLIVRTPQDSIEGLRRTLKNITRYINVVLLFLVFVGFFAGFYLLQIMLKNRSLEFALSLFYNCGRMQLQLASFCWILLLTGLAAFMGLALGEVLFSAVNSVLEKQLPFEIRLSLSLTSSLFLFFVVLLNSIFFALPRLFPLKYLDLNSLLNRSLPEIPERHMSLEYIISLVAVFTYVGAITLLLDSIQMGLYLSLTIAALSYCSYYALPKLFLFLIGKNKIRGLKRIALLNIARPRAITYLVWISFAWVSLLLSLIPNILERSRQELAAPDKASVPQIFVINLQEADVIPFEKAVAAIGGALRYPTPLLQGRLLSINEKPILEGRLARFPVRVSYLSSPQQRQEVVEGTPITTKGLSIEIEFARRENIKVGDVLEFEISGVKMSSPVENLRTVQWNTFRPNFFILFPNGVLNDFPKSYLATIYGIKDDAIYSSQSRLSNQFPSLSLLNLSSTLQRITELAGRLIYVIQAISYTAIFLTLLLVFILLWFQRSARQPESHLLFELGTARKQTKRIYEFESMVWSGSSLFVGFLIGTLASVIVGKMFFESYHWPPRFFQGALICILLGFIMVKLPKTERF